VNIVSGMCLLAYFLGQMRGFGDKFAGIVRIECLFLKFFEIIIIRPTNTFKEFVEHEMFVKLKTELHSARVFVCYSECKEQYLKLKSEVRRRKGGGGGGGGRRV